MQIFACETNSAEVCGTWTRLNNSAEYIAQWPQGSEAIITVVRFDATGVVFDRRDTEGPTPDMVARYTGIPEGREVQDGVVRWTTGGWTFQGSWRATW